MQINIVPTKYTKYNQITDELLSIKK